MQAYFWGTRGSLPVGPDGAVIRQKIKQALLKANGRRFDGDAGVVHRLAGGGESRGAPLDRALEGLGIDLEEELALLHGVALLDGERRHPAGRTHS